jgi:rhodanese-related sulfurtransferase
MFFLSATLLESCHKKVEVSNFESVDVEQFKSVILSNDVQCVDVRTESEYQDGHIEGSINIDVLKPDFSKTATDILKKEQTVAIYCRSGNRSKKAGEILAEMGFHVVELNVGYKGWVEQTK